MDNEPINLPSETESQRQILLALIESGCRRLEYTSDSDDIKQWHNAYQDKINTLQDGLQTINWFEFRLLPVEEITSRRRI